MSKKHATSELELVTNEHMGGVETETELINTNIDEENAGAQTDDGQTKTSTESGRIMQ
jgi:hypothetical protein